MKRNRWRQNNCPCFNRSPSFSQPKPFSHIPILLSFIFVILIIINLILFYFVLYEIIILHRFYYLLSPTSKSQTRHCR
ncbi:hypothetical protein Lalb_Chr13g0300721 [Lupinus albus]|uniref:Uncharacterized protein n=1 Tax=Lupinus albus TaxID=3870 RepID=A0A6A4PJI5_LUPAL|nr:hypothetical protein Lalb_Chr13g0300721 [Lupinus albus]